MKLTKTHLKNVQIELFFEQLNALGREDAELLEHYNIARNLACSEWEYNSIPSVCGGRQGLRISRMIPDQMKLLKKNYEQQRQEISYRRYALIKAYYPIVKDRIGDLTAECYEYWEKTKSL